MQRRTTAERRSDTSTLQGRGRATTRHRGGSSAESVGEDTAHGTAQRSDAPVGDAEEKKHFAVRCNNKQDTEIKSNEEDFDILDVSVDSVMRQRDWVVQAQVANKVLELKVDTGAQANLLPYCMFRRLQPRMQLKASNSVLRSYDGGVNKHL